MMNAKNIVEYGIGCVLGMSFVYFWQLLSLPQLPAPQWISEMPSIVMYWIFVYATFVFFRALVELIWDEWKHVERRKNLD